MYATASKKLVSRGSAALFFLLVVSILLSVAGCSSEPKFSAECTSVSVNPETQDVEIVVTVTNEGSRIKHTYSLSSFFGPAQIISADGTAYSSKSGLVSGPEMTSYFKRGDTATDTLTFPAVKESGIYTLIVRYMGVELEIPNIEIIILE